MCCKGSVMSGRVLVSLRYSTVKLCFVAVKQSNVMKCAGNVMDRTVTGNARVVHSYVLVQQRRVLLCDCIVMPSIVRRLPGLGEGG